MSEVKEYRVRSSDYSLINIADRLFMDKGRVYADQWKMLFMLNPSCLKHPPKTGDILYYPSESYYDLDGESTFKLDGINFQSAGSNRFWFPDSTAYLACVAMTIEYFGCERKWQEIRTRHKRCEYRSTPWFDKEPQLCHELRMFCGWHRRKLNGWRDYKWLLKKYGVYTNFDSKDRTHLMLDRLKQGRPQVVVIRTGLVEKPVFVFGHKKTEHDEYVVFHDPTGDDICDNEDSHSVYPMKFFTSVSCSRIKGFLSTMSLRKK